MLRGDVHDQHVGAGGQVATVAGQREVGHRRAVAVNEPDETGFPGTDAERDLPWAADVV